MCSLPRVALVCATFVIAACSSTPSATDVLQDSNQGRVKWFCQMSENGEDWDCVQDDELAENPTPERFPTPTQPELEAPAEYTLNPEPQQVGQFDAPAPVAVAPVRPRNVNALPESAPAFQRLAFQPERPMRLIELPADFYTVQLLAVEEKDQLEKYVMNADLRGLSAARVEKDGALFYVLLLGIYPDEESATLAADAMPDQIGHLTPWVRELGSLQEAMLRGDRLAGTSEV